MPGHRLQLWSQPGPCPSRAPCLLRSPESQPALRVLRGGWEGRGVRERCWVTKVCPLNANRCYDYSGLLEDAVKSLLGPGIQWVLPSGLILCPTPSPRPPPAVGLPHLTGCPMTASHRPPSRQGLRAPKLRSLPSGKPAPGEGSLLAGEEIL